MRLTLAIALLGLAACSPYPGAQVSTEPDGGMRVQVQEAQSFNALARFLYDDARLGPAVAEIAGLDYDSGVPARSVLMLPPKPVVQTHAEATRRVGNLEKGARKAADKGEFAEAARKYREALEIRPGRTDLVLALGQAQHRAGDLGEASASLQQAAREMPNDPEARYAFASVLRAQGKLANARAEYEAALASLVEGTTHPRATYEYARTLEDLGETEEATEIYRRFMYEHPSDPWVGDVKDRLEELEKAP